MCLRAFLAARPVAAIRRGRTTGSRPARGGSVPPSRSSTSFATSAEDHDVLGRSYFPGLDVERFSDADRDRILDDIDVDLAAAAAVVPELPASSRRAVRAAHAMFAELARRLRDTPAAEIRRHAGPGPRRRSRCGSSPARSTAVVRDLGSPAATSRRRGRRVASGRRRRRRHRRARHRRPARLATATASTCSRRTTTSVVASVASSATASASTPAPSWYLMPEVFEHFFALLGTSAAERARPDRARPELPRLLRGPPRPCRPPPGPRAQPGALRVARARCRGARSTPTCARREETYDLALRRFLYTKLRLRRRPFLAPRRGTPDARGSARLLTPLAGEPRRGARSPTTGSGRSSAIPRCSSAPRPPGRRACTT